MAFGTKGLHMFTSAHAAVWALCCLSFDARVWRLNQCAVLDRLCPDHRRWWFLKLFLVCWSLARGTTHALNSAVGSVVQIHSCLYMYVSTSLRIWTYPNISVHITYPYIHAYLCVSIHVHAHSYISTHNDTYLYMSLRIKTCLHMSTHTHLYM